MKLIEFIIIFEFIMLGFIIGISLTWMEGVINMKPLNDYEEKTDTEICSNYIKRFIVGIFIVLFYIAFVAIINIT